MYQLRYELIGKTSGNFRPKFEQPQKTYFLKFLEHQLNKHDINRIFSPYCQMTTNVVAMGQGKETKITPWFIRTSKGIDGAMITEPNVAICLFNADCPVIVLFDKKIGRLVLLHAGFRCLVPNSNKPNIVKTAFRQFQLDPDTLEAYIGFGAGRCCYGINHYFHELYEPKYAPFLWQTEKGPRRGQRSLDLLNLARWQLRNFGLPDKSITVNHKCTACKDRDNGQGMYYSNIYEGSSTGRNLVLAWYTHESPLLNL